ncbi:MAG TPA: hypothetical protein DD379_02725 [Cyanobacteria bacterium UBA11162]|nr:hypothetical protein [Cyanobacteria bacterium UBA11162]
MDTQEINGEDYRVHYNPESVTVSFIGELSLSGPADYAPIAQLLDDVANQEPSTMILDLRKLEFLNSSGISLVSKFAINMRKRKTIQVIVMGSNTIPWQGKSLKNLEKLFPGLKLELE